MARCRRGSRIMSARTGEGIVQKSGIDENDTVTSARAGRQSQLVLKLVAALVLAAIVFVFAVPRVIEGLFLGVGKGVAEVVKAPFTGAGQLVKDSLAFLTPNITNVFETRVLATRTETNLHVATWKGEVSLRKKEESGWTKAEVEAVRPAEVPLYVSFAKNAWRFRVADRTLFVMPPGIEYGSASMDISHEAARALETSWRISETRMIADVKEQLNKEGGNMARKQAVSAVDNARSGVAAFIRSWVLEPYFPENKDARIVVVFPGEPTPTDFWSSGPSSSEPDTLPNLRPSGPGR